MAKTPTDSLFGPAVSGMDSWAAYHKGRQDGPLDHGGGRWWEGFAWGFLWGGFFVLYLLLLPSIRV